MPCARTLRDVDDQRSAPEAVLLAEYGELRREIGQCSATQHALFALNLAAVGAVVGFVVEGASASLLLVIPLASPMLGLLWLDNQSKIERITRYIRHEVWLWSPSWVEYVERNPHPRWWALHWTAIFLMFPGVSGVALGLAHPASAGEWLAWSLGTSLTAICSGVFVYTARGGPWNQGGG